MLQQHRPNNARQLALVRRSTGPRTECYRNKRFPAASKAANWRGGASQYTPLGQFPNDAESIKMQRQQHQPLQIIPRVWAPQPDLQLPTQLRPAHLRRCTCGITSTSRRCLSCTNKQNRRCDRRRRSCMCCRYVPESVGLACFSRMWDSMQKQLKDDRCLQVLEACSMWCDTRDVQSIDCDTQAWLATRNVF